MKPIEVRRNGSSCMIRWSYKGQRYSITHGTWDLPPGTRFNVEKLRLENCGKLIATDIALGEFDTTLSKYNYYLLGVLPPELPKAKEPEKPALIQVIEQRLKEKYSASDDSVLHLLRAYSKPIIDINDAKAFMRWLSEVRGVKDSTKSRYLTSLRTARPDLFHLFKVKVGETPKPKPFTKDEIDGILECLKNDKSCYHDFILFLFNTGCRTSEAIGLQWKHVDMEKREVHIYESLVRVNGCPGKRIRKPTKTSKYRVLPLNNKLYKMLKERGPGEPTSSISCLDRGESLVFTSALGKPINDHSVSQHLWKKMLIKLGIPHRPLYNTRHTFVSHAIASGMLPAEVASITGHSVDVLYEHYLGSVKRPTLPEL